MKMKLSAFVGVCFLILSCTTENTLVIPPISVTLNFSHSWEDTTITNADFNDIKFTNENGEQLSIERLRYVISEIVLTHESGIVTTLNEYNLVDVTNNQGLTFTTSESIVIGNYTNISFRFGFADSDNIDGAYTDLNTANFNVPGMLGGGYHYMQLDGKYLDSSNAEAPFNYHAIRAVDTTDPDDLLFKDTSFQVDLGPLTVRRGTIITINMDVSEWFKNPNTWDLNVLNTVLMPDFGAQLLMNANGASVFSLVSITP